MKFRGTFKAVEEAASAGKQGPTLQVFKRHFKAPISSLTFNAEYDLLSLTVFHMLCTVYVTCLVSSFS